MIRVFENRKPNVKSLARKGDVDGLIDAAHHSATVPGPDGAPMDVGAPVREEALIALGKVAPERAREVFVKALGDSSDRVRCAAVVALYEQKDSAQLAEAIVRLRGSGRARAMAVRALFELRRPGSSSRLADALVHRSGHQPLSETDAALVPALIRAENRPDAAAEVVDRLVSLLGHERDVVRARAEALLVRLGPASTESLVGELSSGAAPHRAAAMLAQIKDERALQPLMNGLSHPAARVRSECCFALGELRDPAAVERLVHAIHDPDHHVRVRAGAALDRMGTAAVAVSMAALLRPSGPSLAEGSVAGLLVNGDWAHAASSIALDDLSSVERIEVVWETDASDSGD